MDHILVVDDEESARFVIKHVITSYSIHYTKLYDEYRIFTPENIRLRQ